MKRETVGKISTDLLEKEKDIYDPREIQEAVHKNYINDLEWSVLHAQKKASCKEECPKKCSDRISLDGDIFIEVITKKERLMKNVLRNYFIAKKSCPTPTWDQSVFHYKKSSETIEYVWTVPDKNTCSLFSRHVAHVDPAEEDLLKMVMDFENGELLLKAQKLNGEIKDGTPTISPIIITTQERN